MRQNFLLSLLMLGLLMLVGIVSSAGVPRQPIPNSLDNLTPSATITETPSNHFRMEQMLTAQAPLTITFEGVYSLALEFRSPLRAALDANREMLQELDYTVSAYRDSAGWAKITLVPSRFVKDGWANVELISPVEVMMKQLTSGEWEGYVVGSAAFAAVMGEVPRTFVDYLSPLPPVIEMYKFPWQSDHEWWAIQGWHEGNALDFQPGLATRFGVLAAQAGRLRELCSDGTQSFLQIQHADGRSTYYLHVTMGLAVRRRLLDQPIQQGQYLGDLLRRQSFVTPCGQGYSRHLHFAVSDRALSIEGYALEGVAASASCCNHPPTYRSSNVRVDVSVAD